MKPILLILSLTFVLFTNARAALITGNVQDTGLAPTATNLMFRPLSTPMARGASVILSSDKTLTTDTNGDFALSLAPGNYKVTVGDNAADSFLISVPDGESTNQWTDIATGTLVYRYPFSPAYLDRAIAQARGDLFVFDGTNVVRIGP